MINVGRRVIVISGSLLWSKTLMELIFNPWMNFGEVRRAQIDKYILLTSTCKPWDLFTLFKICSDAKERESGMRKATESYGTYSSLVKLQPWFLSLRWRTAFEQNCSPGTWVCSKKPALGQNTLMIILLRLSFKI